MKFLYFLLILIIIIVLLYNSTKITDSTLWSKIESEYTKSSKKELGCSLSHIKAILTSSLCLPIAIVLVISVVPSRYWPPLSTNNILFCCTALLLA